MGGDTALGVVADYEKRQQQKRDVEGYREAARRIYGHEGDSTRLTVPVHANVSACEDGAFVEVVVWVPVSQLTTPQSNT